MSSAESPAPSESETKRGEVTYRFCQDCSNLLYPKENRSTSELLFYCKACHAVQKYDTACTYRNHLSATVTETAGVTTDVANDPTVGDDSSDIPAFCTMCGDQIKCAGCRLPTTESSELSEYSENSERTKSSL